MHFSPSGGCLLFTFKQRTEIKMRKYDMKFILLNLNNSQIHLKFTKCSHQIYFRLCGERGKDDENLCHRLCKNKICSREIFFCLTIFGFFRIFGKFRSNSNICSTVLFSVWNQNDFFVENDFLYLRKSHLVLVQNCVKYSKRLGEI